jgi:hypothetical protein
MVGDWFGENRWAKGGEGPYYLCFFGGYDAGSRFSMSLPVVNDGAVVRGLIYHSYVERAEYLRFRHASQAISDCCRDDNTGFVMGWRERPDTYACCMELLS